jgi:NNMT/PNMT/TEMT family protein
MADRRPGTPNKSVPWSDFDAEAYWKFNYDSLLPEDAQIIRRASDFLIEACEGRAPISSAVDVGAGTNLYPALLMLPWTERIVFTEYASDNIHWLNQNLADAPGEWTWQPFWDLVAGRPGYRDVEQPRRRLAAHQDVRYLSIFDLPSRAWDLGSMFFVADGITTDEEEFEAAVSCFLGSLTPGAPFLMAFMENSEGYDVNGVNFPAVEVTRESLAALLTRVPVRGTDVLETDNTIRRLRPGYDAMLLVTGYVDERADRAG